MSKADSSLKYSKSSTYVSNLWVLHSAGINQSCEVVIMNYTS